VKNLEQWAAVRQASDDKHEFIDVSTIRCLQELTIHEAKDAAITNPYFHKANPVIRYTMVNITEI
jgi:hypothetical protein